MLGYASCARGKSGQILRFRLRTHVSLAVDQASDSQAKKSSRWSRFLNLRLLGDVGFVVAAVTFLEYCSHRTEVVDERTMTYITRYEDGSVAAARRLISTKLRPIIDELDDQGVTNVVDRQKRVALEAETPEGSGLVDAIDTLVDFFTGLRTCVDRELCSKPLSIAYFGGSASQIFHENFKAYFDIQRKKNPEYACDVTWFAEGKDTAPCIEAKKRAPRS